jgi:glucose-1-phosphate adenylyltransferase
MVAERDDIYAYPFSGYWVDVGTVNSYWQAHMDLLCVPPTLDLHTRGWVVHTRSEERPPANIQKGARVEDSLVCDGCIIEDGACVYRSVLSPGVIVRSGAVVHHSILLTDTQVQPGAVIKYAIVDKRSTIGEKAVIGGDPDGEPAIALVGKNSVVPPGTVIQPGAVVGTDVIPPDYTVSVVQSGQYIQTRRLPNEL